VRPPGLPATLGLSPNVRIHLAKARERLDLLTLHRSSNAPRPSSSSIGTNSLPHLPSPRQRLPRQLYRHIPRPHPHQQLSRLQRNTPR